MFLDLTIESHGKYAILATVKGSYGEEQYVQVSRARIDPEGAARRAYALAQDPRYKNVTLKNVDTGRVYYFEKGSDKWRANKTEIADMKAYVLEEAVGNVTAKNCMESSFVQKIHRLPAGTVAGWLA